MHWLISVRGYHIGLKDVIIANSISYVLVKRMCLCGSDVQYSNFVSPDRYQYRLQLSTDSQFCKQLGTPISMPTTRTPFMRRLYFTYQYTGQIISFQMMPSMMLTEKSEA